MKEYLLDGIESVIDTTIKALENVSEEMADKRPTSFPDSIRWNTGHTYFLGEMIAFQIVGGAAVIPEGFKEMFGTNGGSDSKNIDYSGYKVPEMKELIKLLEDQKIRIRKDYEGKVHNDFEKPISLPWVTFNNTEELLLMVYSHASFHKGILTRYINILA